MHGHRPNVDSSTVRIAKCITLHYTHVVLIYLVKVHFVRPSFDLKYKSTYCECICTRGHLFVDVYLLPFVNATHQFFNEHNVLFGETILSEVALDTRMHIQHVVKQFD